MLRAGAVPQPADAGRVEIWDCPFTTYRVPADTNWALAYYKLCAMAWVLENRNFARAAMLDLDTFTQRPLDDLWRECARPCCCIRSPRRQPDDDRRHQPLL